MIKPLLVVGTAVLGAAGSDIIGPGTHISLGTVFAVVVPVGGAVWWLAGELRGMKDSINQLHDKVNTLPCQKTGVCPDQK